MTIEQFEESLNQNSPPLITALLKALWYDSKGDWEMAHTLAQSDPTKDGAWVHAYLHRKEGDEGNASYWYERAGKKKPNLSLDEEWRQMAIELIS